MATVFWDLQGVITLPTWRRVIRRRIPEKVPYLAKKKIFFRHENASDHTSIVATAHLFKLFYELVPLHRLLQIWLCMKLQNVTRRAEFWDEWGGYRRHDGLISRPPENIYLRRVRKLEHRGVKFIESPPCIWLWLSPNPKGGRLHTNISLCTYMCAYVVCDYSE